MTMVITGLDVTAKADRAEAMLAELLGGTAQYEDFSVELIDSARPDAPSNAGATALLRVTVRDPDPDKVGRRFSNAVVALALASYSGFYTTTPPQTQSAYGVYWPTLVPVPAMGHTVRIGGGVTKTIEPPPVRAWQEPPADAEEGPLDPEVETVDAPLGAICGARSGDKGGNANVGLWAREDRAYKWMRSYLTASKLRSLLGKEAKDLEVRRYALPNLRALNFVVVGLLGAGVASSTRYDPQAKGLGEYVRSRVVPIPARLLDGRYGRG
jgi:hypothetical protein